MIGTGMEVLRCGGSSGFIVSEDFLTALAIYKYIIYSIVKTRIWKAEEKT